MSDQSNPGTSTPNPIGAAVQISCLLCLAIYAVVGLLSSQPLDRWVLYTIGAIGIGARPETIVNLFRSRT